jgi:FixJ family two-component response regulator
VQEKILFVDDEISILQGYQRLLRSEFPIDTAVGGDIALHSFNTTGPYAVVVSDMHMPLMTGIELLCEIKKLSPDTVPIMLSGNADLNVAIAAINEGSIFRFLTKPCTKETLAKALNAALMQFRLVRAERELLEHTLKGSIQVLSEVLSLVNPRAFGRAMRLRRYMSHIVAHVKLPRPWRFEIAALMSQLGCVVLAPETIEAIFSGRDLSPEQQAQYASHPQVGRKLLENIPRMEPIAWMIGHQNQPTSVESDITDREMADMRLGADFLQVVIAFDDLIRKGKSRVEAANLLIRKYRHVDQQILYSLVELDPEKEDERSEECSIEELAPGMVLAADIYDQREALVVTKGQEVTSTLILKLKSLRQVGSIADSAYVLSTNDKSAGAAAGY